MKDRLSNEFKKNVYLKPDEYLNGWARKCGWKASLVYDSLWRHADKARQCFPSIELMAKEHGVGYNTIRRGLKTLLDYNLVKKDRKRNRKGKFFRNLYTLTDKSKWREPISPQPSQGDGSSIAPTGKTHSPHRAIKDTHREGYTTYRGIVDKITKWAYERSAYPPSCPQSSFRKTVLVAVERVGAEKVNKAFENEENAIQFLTNLKTL